jgi:hypothetical protein
MPWKPSQQRAIAANMARQGKSREEISRFFRSHGYGHGKNALIEAHRKSKKGRH